MGTRALTVTRFVSYVIGTQFQTFLYIPFVAPTRDVKQAYSENTLLLLKITCDNTLVACVLIAPKVVYI